MSKHVNQAGLFIIVDNSYGGLKNSWLYVHVCICLKL